jgi:hypothetical protein
MTVKAYSAHLRGMFADGAMNILLTFTLCILLKIYLMQEREIIFCNSGDAIKVLV